MFAQELNSGKIAIASFDRKSAETKACAGHRVAALEIESVLRPAKPMVRHLKGSEALAGLSGQEDKV